MRTLSLTQRSALLKDYRRKLKSLKAENDRLKSYIAALEPMAVRSLSLTRAQLKSAVRRRQNLNLTEQKPCAIS